MFGFIRRLKLTYCVYNFFHKKKLIHNCAAYKKLGLKKKYYSTVSSKTFNHLPDQQERSNSNPIQNTNFLNGLTNEIRQSIQDFNDKGYAIISSFFSAAEVDTMNQDIDNMLTSGSIKFTSNKKIMFAFRHSESIQKAGKNKQLLTILYYLLGREVILFQSINFLKGSQQRTHSDSIHMTTYPLGNLIAVWVALEDITETNGPLHYYEGSHKLPYYLNKDYENEGNQFLLGKKSYREYEEMIEKKISQHQLQKKVFLAKKGDILIWHANLFHGGNLQTDINQTRKSMVFHYFGKDVICYHEISQRPALMSVE